MIELQPIQSMIDNATSYNELEALTDALRAFILKARDKQASLLEPRYIAQLLGDSTRGTYYTIGYSKYLDKMQKRIEKKCTVEGCYWDTEHTYVRKRDAYGAYPRAKIIVRYYGKS